MTDYRFTASPSQVPLVESNKGTWEWLRWFIDLTTFVSPNPNVPSAITVGASPYNYQNTLANPRDIDVIVEGGTVTQIDFSRDGSTYYNVGVIAGMFRLNYGEYLKVTYAVVPNMTLVPR